MIRRYTLLYILAALAIVVTFMLASCSAEKFIGDDELMLRKVRVSVDNGRVKPSELLQYNRQRPNTKWLSSMKVPLGVYSLSGTDSTKWINRTLRNLGEAPVILDTILMGKSANDITYAMYNRGYLNAVVTPKLDVSGKKAILTYQVTAGRPYVISSVKYDIRDSVIASKLNDTHLQLHSGEVFTIESLNEERRRITSFLQDEGYYQFNKEFINYDVDSSEVNHTVDLTMHLNLYRRNSNSPLTLHPRYLVRSLAYDIPKDEGVNLRGKVVENNTAIEVGKPYSASKLQQTYNNFSRLQAVRYTNIHFVEQPDSQLLDCHIQLSRSKVNSILFQPEGTNTAGDLGAAASLTFQNRNLFHGSEVLSITGRAAYEAISKLEGYQNQDYVEYGLEGSLTFPRFLFPFIPDRNFRGKNAVSELSISYNLQDRPEFHRRLFNASWGYKWTDAKHHAQYKIDMIDVNYLSMPWISETFKHDYLDSVSNRNVILRYNYEDLLIMKIGFGYTWSHNGNMFRFNVESAGNLLHALSTPFRFKQKESGEREFMGIAFAQYVKGDFEYTRMFQLDNRNALVLHGRLGIAYPYGNSTMLPFEKRYFAGGANSLRGWSVRSLGPGGYKHKDGRIDFINQTGDMRLDLNVELRTSLFWKFQGAVFADAGNIWTLREYNDQPNGQFRFSTFLDQLAANYGIGIRLNFDYFVVRFDGGMKAVNPAYNTTREHFPILYPRFSRDFAFHFAVGMPF